MANAVGGNIKVTLTLDDAGFSVKTKEARDNVKGMNSEIGRAASTVSTFETKLGNLGKNVTLTSNNFKTLQTTAKSLDSQFATMGKSMASFNTMAATASQNADLLNGVVLKLARLLDGAATESNKAAAASDKLASAQRNLASTSASTVNGLTAQERALRNLGEAHTTMATKIVLAAGLRKNENAKMLAEELSANNQMINKKQETLQKMIKVERDYQNQLTAERSKAMAIQQQMENRRGTGGRMMSTSSPEYIARNAALQRELDLTNQKISALQRSVDLVGQEGVKLTANLGILRQESSAISDRIGLEGRIEAALQRQNERARAYLATQKEQAAQAKQQAETVRQQAEMLKGMGQLYAGSKIEQGEKKSVSAAGEFQRTSVRASAMGLSAEEKAQFDYMTKYDSENHPGLSYNDAATARIGAMGGLASKNQRQINQTLPSAIDAAQNLQYITGDEGHENFENMIRNLYGVAEARQVQYDPAKTKSTFEMLQKIVTATGNKIDIADVETLLRRVGTGNAAQLSNDGIIDAVALMDQLKVSGGAGGGGAGGVSTLGTMIKMLQSYGNGKTMSNEMVKQFAEAGLLNTDSISSKNADGSVNATDSSIKKFMAEAKKAGFINVGKLNESPIAAIRDMMKSVLATIASPENRKKYFGDADVNDPEAQRDALSKWATRNGMTTTATQLLTTVADPRMQERIDHQHEMISGSAGIDQLKQLRMDTYEQQVKNFDAAMKNLQVTLGTTVLPLMTSLFEWLTKVINKISEFGTNNPMVTEFAMIGGAIGGVVLSLKGMMTMFGVVGNLRTLLTLVGGAGEAGAAKVGLMSRAFSVLGGLATTMLSPLTALFTRFAGTLVGGTMLASITAFGSRVAGLGARFLGLGTVIGGAAKLIGGIFLRMIPFVGWLYTAWELGSLLMNVEVGFTRIGDYLGHWLTQMMLKFELWAAKGRNLFRFGAESNAEGDAHVAQLEADAEADSKYFANLQAENKKYGEAEAKRKADAKAKDEQDQKELQDMIAGKGFEHKDPKATIDPELGLKGFTIPEAPAKEKRAPRDQFARSLAEVTSKQEITAMQITSQITGKADDLLEQARTEFFEKWKAGDFDPDHDANKRPFKNATGGLNWQASGASGDVQQWINTRAQMLQQEEQLKALKYANERITAAREDANTAMERGTEDTSKQTREMAGLTRELARTEERLKNGTKEFDAWGAKKNEALFERSRADLVNYTADFKEGDRTTQDSMVYNSKDRIAAQFDSKAQKDLETYNLRLKTMTENYTAARAAALKLQEDGLVGQEDTNAKLKSLDDEFNDARTRAETTFTEHVKVQANAREYAIRGAVEKQQQEWENAFDKMDEVTANWGNSFISNLSTALTGGTVEWKSFLASMLKDILDMKLKETFAKPLSGLLDTAGTTLTSLFSSKTKATGAEGSATTGVMSSVTGLLGSAGSSIKSGLGSVASFFGLDKLTSAAGLATDSVKSLATDGASQATAGLVKTALQTTVQSTAQTTATASLTSFGFAVQAATMALAQMAASAGGSSATSLLGSLISSGVSAYAGSYGGAATATTGVTSGTGTGFGLGQTAVGTSSVFGFANGGIMSNMGSLPLKKYANGGIADSPQLALFGEGKYKEAYVPLPDGRSIPVSFSGGTGDNVGTGNVNAPVVISITINNDGTENTTDDSSGQREDAATLASKIKSLVRETLITENKPGGILNKQKSA